MLDLARDPIDVQANVSGSVLVPISVSPPHIQFHFNCLKSWYLVDMASPPKDVEISYFYLMNAKQNLMLI